MTKHFVTELRFTSTLISWTQCLCSKNQCLCFKCHSTLLYDSGKGSVCIFTCLSVSDLALSLEVPVSHTQMAVLVPPVITSFGFGHMAQRIWPHSDRHSYTTNAWEGDWRLRLNIGLLGVQRWGNEDGGICLYQHLCNRLHYKSFKGLSWFTNLVWVRQ